MNESPTSIAILLLNREVLFQPNFEILNPKLKMPPQVPKPTKPRNCGPPFTIPKPTNKFYFFYGHRNPSQNRPTVRGGLFSNRQTLTLPNPNPPPNPSTSKTGTLTSSPTQTQTPPHQPSPPPPYASPRSRASSSMPSAETTTSGAPTSPPNSASSAG